MGDKSASPDERIALIAARQHGVVALRQLLAAGMSRNSASKRCRKGSLHRIHQGVYAVGHPRLTPEGRWLAAVLACGDGAVLSHLSAAALWGLLRDPRETVHVTVPSHSGRELRAGIRHHRRASLARSAITGHRGIPVTTPTQTLADLGGRVSPGQYRRAIRQAEVLGMRTGLERAEPTRSELEDAFLLLCRAHRVPKPEVNVGVGPYEVDFLWPPERLIVETDGYRYHRGAQAFEDDHARDLALRSRGYTVCRFTYRQVTEEPDQVAGTVEEALKRSAT